MNEFNIIPKYGGVVVHDCWSAYLSYGDYDHTLCGSHKRYCNILMCGEKELPPIPKSKKGRRGKIAKSDAHNLWESVNPMIAAQMALTGEIYKTGELQNC